MRLLTRWAIAAGCALSACGGGGGSGGGGGGGDAGTFAHVALAATGPTSRIANGNTAVIDVVVTNTGTQTATNVATTFFAFADVRFTVLECSASGGAVCPFTSRTFSGPLPVQSFTTTAATMPAQGSLAFRLTELLQSSMPESMQTTLSVTADGQTAGVDARVDVVLDTYIVQLSVAGGALTPTVAPGSNAIYVMAVSNDGPSDATNAVVSNDVGLHQTLVSATCVAAGGALCPTTASDGARMSIPLLPVGGRLVFTMTAAVAADANGLISDVFSVSDPGERFGSDNLRTATTQATSSPGGSFLVLHSDPGDALGRSASYAYTQADASIKVSNDEPNLLLLGVDGNESWRGTVRIPGAPAALQPGTYTFAPPTPGTTGSFSFSGSDSGCVQTRTQLEIDTVAYSGAVLSAIDLRFDVACEGSVAALHGQLHWAAADTTQPPGPTVPPPSLWRAPAGSTPSARNYVYLTSDPGDSLGGGKTSVLTQANATFDVRSTVPGQLDIAMQADDAVRAAFRGPATQTQLQPGYYGPLQSWPVSNPTIGALTWSLGGLGCNARSGWFVIDDIRYAGTTIASVDARFEQHCDNATAALRGQIHWAPADPTVPPGPVFLPLATYGRRRQARHPLRATTFICAAIQATSLATAVNFSSVPRIPRSRSTQPAPI